MTYLVLARKWRPQTFSDLVGQEHVSQTLRNAIESGRVAHAFLFTGARGVGKTSAARILAKALQCEGGPAAEPCNVCPACLEITAGNSVDVFEIDGASNTGVEDIRELRENIKYLPSRCRFKIFIIDEVHMLSTSAFNALLKTLEEPPSHIKFIFATTEPHKIPITILSRCQRFDFRRIPLAKLVARLRYIVAEEHVVISDESLTAIARKGDGSMRDSLSALDQVLAFCGDQVADDDVISLLGVVDRRLVQEAVQVVIGRDARSCLEIVARVDSQGYSVRCFCQELIDCFRGLIIVKMTENPGELLDLADDDLQRLRQLREAVTFDDLQRHMAILLKAESEMGQSGFTRLVLEMALVRMAMLVPVVPVAELLERLKSLECASGGAPRQGPQPGAAATPPSQTDSPPLPQVAELRQNSAAPAVRPAQEGWPAFVALVNREKKRLGAMLENARPLQFTAEAMVLGLPAGSFHYTCMQDSDALAAVAELATRFFGSTPVVTVKPLSGVASDLPSTLQEKKSRLAADRQRELEQCARSNPVISAVLDIFGGEIGAVVPHDAKEDTD